jgi:hypothetical protein
MVNINLSTSNDDQKSSLFPAEKVIYLVVVIVIWFVTYAGVTIYKSVLEKKTKEIVSERVLKENSVKEGKNKDIFDFQTRLTMADSLVGKKSDVIESLGKIQELMVNGVYLSSYVYDKKDNSLFLIGETSDYTALARQILNFKKSEYLSNIKIDDIENGKGKMNFSVTAIINQSVK